jgi:nitrilase
MRPDWLPDSIPDTGALRKDAEQFDGYSVIVDSSGKVLAGPLVRERGILIADLDLVTPARKRLFDAAGHYNRPDVFRLEVDDRPKPPMVTRSQADRDKASDPEPREAPAVQQRRFE